MNPLWSPSESFKENANLSKYISWLKDSCGLAFKDYEELWRWSVNDISAFWKSVLNYFHVVYDGTYTEVITGTAMPHYRWFEGINLSYAEHVFNNVNTNYPAIIFKNESSTIEKLSWDKLQRETTRIQHHLKQLNITSGDRICAFMPAIPETTMAFLAANSLGAVWSSCSPDFGAGSVLDRFEQIEPRVLFVTDGYSYGGKFFDKTMIIKELIGNLPTLEQIIVVHHTQSLSDDLQNIDKVIFWNDIPAAEKTVLTFERVPFSHPMWVLYSSGTTGLPKAITHSVGGILLEQLKYGTFHNNYKPGDRCFWYTTTGWMMWNYIHGSLLCGGTMVLFDGSSAYPDMHAMWQFIQDAAITHFGTSAGYILACMKADIHPDKFNLDSLQSIGSTGSTLPPEGFNWIYKNIKNDVWLTSMSGGTDVCSAFVGGNPLLEVYNGEIQCRALGCKLEAFDDEGHAIENELGEMVITEPMPSMPVFFWNDPKYERYHESYFDTYPAVWRHGDFIKITEHKGIIIYGRSDATLNRGGIRIGTSEIYRAVDNVTEVKDSLIICLEKPNGEFWMPLFVKMKDGLKLDDEITKKINKVIRESYTPRHVPDEIIPVPDIPYTISGKKTESPVKKVLMGKDPAKVVNVGALRNPESMDYFIALYKTKSRS